MKRILGFSLAAGLLLAACSEQNTITTPTENPSAATVKPPKTYVIALSAGAPSDLAIRIERAGGKARKIFQKARVATAESDAPGFAAQLRALPGVKAVAEDRLVQWVDPDQRVLPA